jgi:DNA gyrase subunit A
MEAVAAATTSTSVSTVTPKVDTDVVVVTQRAQIKRTALKEYPARKRGGAGVTAISLVKGDRIAGATAASTGSEVIVSCASGQSRQIPLGELKRQGRATKGSRLFTIEGDDRVTALGVTSGR